MSSINTTEGSSVAPEETAYGSSLRNKKLFSSLDKTLNVTEQQLQQSLARNLLKPLRRRVKKSESEPVSKLVEEMVGDWRILAQERIQDILTENEVSASLFKLDEMIAREKKRRADGDGDSKPRAAWRPTGNPSIDTAASCTIRCLEYRDRLKEAVEKMESDLAANRREVERGRERVMATDQEISALGKQLKKEMKLIKSKRDENGLPISSNEELAEIRDKIKKHFQ